MKPIWYTNRKDVAKVFERNGFQCITDLSEYKPDWLWCYSMPSPTFLDLDETQLWSEPYLTPIRHTPILKGKKKIGIKCMGNPKYDQDLHRTIPFKRLIECIPEDYTIYSFHIDEELQHPRVVSLKDNIKTWDDTLDLISQMDCVVSSCTSIAHAAGAIGAPLFVLVPILNYYTWARPGKQSMWYGSNVTVLRQTEYDNWNSPLDELKSILCTQNTTL